ncbi:Uncharacterised protein [Vibrio cholerae]|nr:Uncharacterised protein [Vibrio cholerae]
MEHRQQYGTSNQRQNGQQQKQPVTPLLWRSDKRRHDFVEDAIRRFAFFLMMPSLKEFTRQPRGKHKSHGQRNQHAH